MSQYIKKHQGMALVRVLMQPAVSRVHIGKSLACFGKDGGLDSGGEGKIRKAGMCGQIYGVERNLRRQAGSGVGCRRETLETARSVQGPLQCPR